MVSLESMKFRDIFEYVKKMDTKDSLIDENFFYIDLNENKKIMSFLNENNLDKLMKNYREELDKYEFALPPVGEPKHKNVGIEDDKSLAISYPFRKDLFDFKTVYKAGDSIAYESLMVSPNDYTKDNLEIITSKERIYLNDEGYWRQKNPKIGKTEERLKNLVYSHLEKRIFFFYKDLAKNN